MSIKNQTILSGNLGSDPNHIIQNGKEFVVIKLAINKSYFDKERKEWVKKDPDWFDIYAFDFLAVKAKELKKGDFIRVEAELSNQKKPIEGKNFELVRIVAKSIERIEKLDKVILPNIPNFDSTNEIPF